MQAFEVDDLAVERARSGDAYHEFLRLPALSAGLYVLPAGGRDPQRPHTEDELYVVTAGRARIAVGGEDRAVGPGSVVFVAAGVEHRFHGIDEELSVLVIFAPAESARAGAPPPPAAVAAPA